MLPLPEIELLVAFRLVGCELNHLALGTTVLLKCEHGLLDEASGTIGVIHVDLRLAVLYVFFAFGQVHEVLH